MKLEKPGNCFFDKRPILFAKNSHKGITERIKFANLLPGSFYKTCNFPKSNHRNYLVCLARNNCKE